MLLKHRLYLIFCRPSSFGQYPNLLIKHTFPFMEFLPKSFPIKKRSRSAQNFDYGPSGDHGDFYFRMYGIPAPFTVA